MGSIRDIVRFGLMQAKDSKESSWNTVDHLPLEATFGDSRQACSTPDLTTYAQ